MVSLCIAPSFNVAVLHLRSVSSRYQFVLQSVLQKVISSHIPAWVTSHRTALPPMYSPSGDCQSLRPLLRNGHSPTPVMTHRYSVEELWRTSRRRIIDTKRWQYHTRYGQAAGLAAVLDCACTPLCVALRLGAIHE